MVQTKRCLTVSRNLSVDDVCWEKSRVMNIPVSQGDVEASAEADSLNNAPRKTYVYTKARWRCRIGVVGPACMHTGACAELQSRHVDERHGTDGHRR
jgi:hypothetical protein